MGLDFLRCENSQNIHCSYAQNVISHSNIIHQLTGMSNLTQMQLYQSLLFLYPADPGPPADAYLSSCSCDF